MLFDTVRRARQRFLANEALRYAAYAVSAAMASLIVLLIAGTQILGWGWLLVLPAITVGGGIYATWRGRPSLYAVAQRVDENLKLSDTLSTALFFGLREREGEMYQAQREQAERIAAGVDTRLAIPLRIPRAFYATAALTLTAGSLFALRYGLDRRLDLQAPLARIVQERLGYAEARQGEKRKPALPDPRHAEQRGLALEESAQKGPGELDAGRDNALDSAEAPDADTKSGSSRPEASKTAQATQLEGGEAKGEQPEGVSANAGSQPAADGKKGPGTGKQGQGDEKQSAGNSGENSGLLGKFRDAMSSLMNKMRQPGSNGAQQQASAQNGQQKSQSGISGQNGKPGQQSDNGQKAEAKDGQPGDDSQTAQSGQTGSPGESGQQPASKQPGSGVGRQDGSKDVKLAEQLAAMGKISEIIGKRAANVSGELTIEVQNSNRQLKTPYAPSAAQHAEAGGEINRDEVPAALQAYVQQYFEQVRKQAANDAAHSKKTVETAKPGM
jgi:hypothetical protein